MEQTTDLDQSFLLKSIQRGIEKELTDYLKIEIERFDLKLSEIAAKYAIDIMKMIDIQTLSDRIILTIRKEDK